MLRPDRKEHLMEAFRRPDGASDPSGLVALQWSLKNNKLLMFGCDSDWKQECWCNYADRSDILCLNDYLHCWRRCRCRIQMLVCNSF